MTKLTFMKWSGTITGISGGTLLAANLSISGYGFILFFYSSVAWLWAGYRMRENSIILLNIVYILINLLGIYRWLFATIW